MNRVVEAGRRADAPDGLDVTQGRGQHEVGHGVSPRPAGSKQAMSVMAPSRSSLASGCAPACRCATRASRPGVEGVEQAGVGPVEPDQRPGERAGRAAGSAAVRGSHDQVVTVAGVGQLDQLA